MNVAASKTSIGTRHWKGITDAVADLAVSFVGAGMMLYSWYWSAIFLGPIIHAFLPFVPVIKPFDGFWGWLMMFILVGVSFYEVRNLDCVNPKNSVEGNRRKVWLAAISFDAGTSAAGIIPALFFLDIHIGGFYFNTFAAGVPIFIFGMIVSFVMAVYGEVVWYEFFSAALGKFKRHGGELFATLFKNAGKHKP